MEKSNITKHENNAVLHTSRAGISPRACVVSTAQSLAFVAKRSTACVAVEATMDTNHGVHLE